jgi:hypothetical protein
MADQLLILGGSLFALMGIVHGSVSFADVFRPAQFTPLDDSVREAMKSTGVRFARGRTSMWDAWLGFNLSHSAGLLIFGATTIWLGRNLTDLAPSQAVLAIPAGVGLIYLALAVRFWFFAPAIGFAAATVCFVAAWWRY